MNISSVLTKHDFTLFQHNHHHYVMSGISLSWSSNL